MRRVEDKKPKKKLELQRETVRELNLAELREVAGGTPTLNCLKNL